MNEAAKTDQVKAKAKAYLEAWKITKHSKMQANTTMTYREKYPNSSELKKRFPFRIKSYRIKSVAFINPVMADVIILAKYQGKMITLYMRLIQEVSAFIPSEAGDWGVNPISIRQVVKKQEVT